MIFDKNRKMGVIISGIWCKKMFLSENDPNYNKELESNLLNFCFLGAGDLEQ